MKEEQYLEDLKEIKDIMNRSSRFISLSGWSGVFAGLFALGGAYAAYHTVYTNQDYLGLRSAVITKESLLTLLAIALLTLLLSIGAGVFFTTREAKKKQQNIWDHQTKRLLSALAIPLVTGGILCFILLSKGYVGIVAPLTLVFYGLALVNASKFTLSEIKSLGLIEIAIGLLALNYIGYGLLFWSIGFGILHIIYGVMMQMKYRS
ncbi:MAG: hypothetical protein ABJF11_05125 [Reichenbachiella sp.]|uniref:hypothetical protein n=1 Tax=Reichenbachiella sp. TaxID=2184521 RepID=UPI0032663BD0